jgi:hypothetical protein
VKQVKPTVLIGYDGTPEGPRFKFDREVRMLLAAHSLPSTPQALLLDLGTDLRGYGRPHKAPFDSAADG